MSIKRTWERAVAARQAASKAAEPPAFQKKEPGEARACERLKNEAQRELHQAANTILKEHGFLASGRKKGRKIPGL